MLLNKVILGMGVHVIRSNASRCVRECSRDAMLSRLMDTFAGLKNLKATH